MKRSSIGMSGAWLALLLVFIGAASPGLAAPKPNVVIIVADDLGYADPGFRGSAIDTPSIDALAAGGMELPRFYVAPICSPTRAALMTGRDPIRLGVSYGVILPWDSGGVHTSEHFMPESFQAAGYQTAIVGKWHLGHSQQGLTPNARGFDHFYGHLHTEVGYYPPFANVGGRDFQRNGKSVEEEGYETYLLAKEAANWIASRDKERPFFLYVPFLAPHEPLAAPEELVEKYAGLKDERPPARSPSDKLSRAARMTGRKSRRPLYAATVEAMDQAIGRILTALDREKIVDETIVLFFSDNGATRVYGRGGGDNSPLRGGKAETYEGGIRVVSLIRWPGMIQSGAKLDQVMTVMDVFPTLASAAGIETRGERKLDGVDMWPAIKRGQRVERDGYVFFGCEIPRYGSFNFTAFDDEWKLVQWVEQDPVSTTVTHELFKISEDPGEYTNLAQAHPERVQAMAEEILHWRALYPINGTRARISAPPGWHPPLDWADYPRPQATLQAQPVESMAPTRPQQYLLDFMLGDRGRLVYDCEPVRWLGGVCKP
ncbi:MAG: sulfatase-like hydrolase/transferase [Deltaproteobacteria bacterium]|nr:sulfatase-like hydrolase/transferase [Deltaproteobacteria bacterium]MBW2420015.1 sulfatase-like hydrolase/transferase [Deltaproteobacteria bacterium]